MSKMSRIALELQEHGFETIEDAQANGYDLIGNKLYETAEHALSCEKEEQLNNIDNAISYIKSLDDIDNMDLLAQVVDDLRAVEKYIKEN